MTNETWIQLIVGTVILGGMGFLITKVMDMNGTLGGVEVKVSTTSERLERIAQALPGMGVYVAQEEITRPVRTVVIASAPTEKRNGEDQFILTVFDTTTSTKWSTPVALASKNDRKTLGALAWFGSDLDEHYASFSRMQAYARTASVYSSLPSDVDAKASFVLGSTSAEDYLSEVAWLAPTPRKSTIAVKIENWKDISEALNKPKGELAP